MFDDFDLYETCEEYYDEDEYDLERKFDELEDELEYYQDR